jgi:hypothetical protein
MARKLALEFGDAETSGASAGGVIVVAGGELLEADVDICSKWCHFPSFKERRFLFEPHKLMRTRQPIHEPGV